MLFPGKLCFIKYRQRCSAKVPFNIFQPTSTCNKQKDSCQSHSPWIPASRCQTADLLRRTSTTWCCLDLSFFESFLPEHMRILLIMQPLTHGIVLPLFFLLNARFADVWKTLVSRPEIGYIIADMQIHARLLWLVFSPWLVHVHQPWWKGATHTHFPVWIVMASVQGQEARTCLIHWPWKWKRLCKNGGFDLGFLDPLRIHRILRYPWPVINYWSAQLYKATLLGISCGFCSHSWL